MRILLLLIFFSCAIGAFGQNVGIDITTPLAKLHIKGTSNISQLIVEGHNTQTSPLIKLRNSSGDDLMWIHSNSPLNTFIGYQAGSNNNSEGLNNTFIGSDAAFFNMSGDYNTATGYQSLFSNSGGGENNAFGHHALYSNVNGYFNQAFGSAALYSNISGAYNTAIGMHALWSGKAGNNGVAVGHFSQRFVHNDPDSWDNTNTSVGYASLRGSLIPANNTGAGNTALGRSTLEKNSFGANNTATGYEALTNNTEGDNNTANGFEALLDNTIGDDNTAVGNFALRNNSSGNHNTAIGLDAGGTQSTGHDCTFLGYSAEAMAGTYTNAMAIGYQAVVNASNEIRIGNSAITEIGGYEPWTNVSDGRFNKNISENVAGLNFIMNLRPVTYNLQVNQLAAHLKEDEHRDTSGQRIHIAPDAFTKQSRDAKEQKLYSGFIAQEVEAAAKSIGYDFSGISKPANAEDLYALSYAEFVVPLVKAVQELSEKNATQEILIQDLMKRLEKLEKNAEQ